MPVQVQCPRCGSEIVPGRAADKAALAFGLLAAVYQQTDSQYKLTLLDAKTGDRKWDIKLQGDTVGGGDADGVVVTNRNVILPRAYGVEVYGVANGKKVGRIGEF